MKYSCEQTSIALPLGEWWQSLQKTIKNTGIEMQKSSDRNYTINLPELKIVGYGVRTKSVPRIVLAKDMRSCAGFTGTDILVDQGLRKLDELTDWPVPLSADAPKPWVYLAETQNTNPTDFMNTSLEMIFRGVVATAFPGILKQYCEQQKICLPRTWIDNGKIEGLPNQNPDISGVLDISSTGTTMRENGLIEFSRVMNSKLVLFCNWAKMTNKDIERIFELQRLLASSN